jgi:hypothetical protein
VTARAAVEDPHGRTVELTEERWTHITERHPELEPLAESVLRVVRSPDRSLQGPEPNEQWYYLETDAPSTWLKVVVAYADERGHIVTAFVRRSMS